MELRIDTSNLERVTLILANGSQNIMHTFQSRYDLSERLPQEITEFLAKQRVKLAKLSKVEVATGPIGFSRARTAVAAANALAFGLNLKQPLIEPVYSSAPNISQPKKLAIRKS